MRAPRRSFLFLLPAVLSRPPSAAAQPRGCNCDFPERPITLVVPFLAGGSTDIAGRILAERMAPHLAPAVRMIVENRAGAGGSVGAEWVRHRTPDGYTLLLGSASADRKSTRLNSSHANISYAVFCLKKNTT